MSDDQLYSIYLQAKEIVDSDDIELNTKYDIERLGGFTEKGASEEWSLKGLPFPGSLSVSRVSVKYYQEVKLNGTPIEERVSITTHRLGFYGTVEHLDLIKYKIEVRKKLTTLDVINLYAQALQLPDNYESKCPFESKHSDGDETIAVRGWRAMIDTDKYGAALVEYKEVAELERPEFTKEPIEYPTKLIAVEFWGTGEKHQINVSGNAVNINAQN